MTVVLNRQSHTHTHTHEHTHTHTHTHRACLSLGGDGRRSQAFAAHSGSPKSFASPWPISHITEFQATLPPSFPPTHPPAPAPTYVLARRPARPPSPSLNNIASQRVTMWCTTVTYRDQHVLSSDFVGAFCSAHKAPKSGSGRVLGVEWIRQCPCTRATGIGGVAARQAGRRMESQPHGRRHGLCGGATSGWRMVEWWSRGGIGAAHGPRRRISRSTGVSPDPGPTHSGKGATHPGKQFGGSTGVSRDHSGDSWWCWGVPLNPGRTQREYRGIPWPLKQTRGIMPAGMYIA